ncbi:uncharacterized protein LOC127860832 [Dreissena polymorpha]|uniref:Uncharacterized protein n=1 Tax=Dreissena polymorpha TaxID=45954 RepID=A0A9D4BDJ8_DREPO|nr:uncharacterized protein LOC127860832 [Dreissena polymorpha]KAH3698910.1 hypothetical protein DPMN_073855 [Dreissena polymorpha]
MITFDAMLSHVSTAVSVNIMLISAQSTESSTSKASSCSNSCLVTDVVIIAVVCLVAVLLGFVLGILARCYMENRRRGEHNLKIEAKATSSRSNENIETPPRTRQYVDATLMNAPRATIANMQYGVPKQRSEQGVENKLMSATSEKTESLSAPPEYVYSYSKSPSDQYTIIDTDKSPNADFTTGSDGYLTPIAKNTKPKKK